MTIEDAPHETEVRRVVTGIDAQGKAVVASDELVAPVVTAAMPDAAFHLIWGYDETPLAPNDGTQPAGPSYFPPAGGFRFGLFAVPPQTTSEASDDDDLRAAFADLEVKLPGMSAHMEPDNPGMHTTATIDCEYVLFGQVILELDDGEQVMLSAGDTVVQNGTRHAWRNVSNAPAVIAVVLVGAQAADDAEPS